MQPRRLSEAVRSSLERAGQHTDTPEDLMRYLTIGAAFLRHYLVSLHDLAPVIHHLNTGIRMLARMETKTVVGGAAGVVSYPVSADMLSDVLAEMIASSYRYRAVATVANQKTGVDGWRQIAEILAPAEVARVVPIRPRAKM